MIRLSLGSNTVALTLTEKTSIVSANYLFEFISVGLEQKYYCIAADTSLYTDRYNLFTLTVQAAAPDPLQGQLQLVYGDEYLYNIYEQVSAVNLDPTGLTVVEIGMMTYGKVITARTEYESALTTRKAYEQ